MMIVATPNGKRKTMVCVDKRESERDTERGRDREGERGEGETERERENSNSHLKTLFYKDCNLGSVKNLPND